MKAACFSKKDKEKEDNVLSSLKAAIAQANERNLRTQLLSIVCGKDKDGKHHYTKDELYITFLKLMFMILTKEDKKQLKERLVPQMNQANITGKGLHFYI